METQPPRTRILLVDDHALFREGAARLLAAESDFAIVGCCGSIDEALQVIQSEPVDLVLLDMDLGKERGIHFFQPAQEIGFQGRVMIVAAIVGPFEARRLIQNGVAGIFSKQNAPGLLVDAIRTIMAGGMYLDPAVREELSDQHASNPSREELSSRHQAVWNGVVEGLTNKEIATRVHISEALVKVTLQQLFDKHGVRTRSQLVRIALEQRSSRP